MTLPELEHLNLKLGKRVDRGGLDAIPRQISRKSCPLPDSTTGFDLWNAYEVSFLLPSGKPAVYHMRVRYDAHSPNIVESKSFKLFLYSLNDQVFGSLGEYSAHIDQALSHCIGSPITLEFYPPDSSPLPHAITGRCIDQLTPVSCPKAYDPSVIKPEEANAEFHFYSHLLRTLCPVTGQPDWGTVTIEGKGSLQPSGSSLLAYIIGFRNHQDFHETCCETLFADLFYTLRPEALRVACFYTRRGGLDINPIRAIGQFQPALLPPVWRQ